MARAINSEVKAGRGSPAGGVFLDIASRLPADAIRKKLPSMYHQFKELADVDITAEPMEVGPTCHYVMGGVEVDPDTAAASRARPVRGRRGGRRHARLEPARRQLAVRPAGLRAPGRAWAPRSTSTRSEPPDRRSPTATSMTPDGRPRRRSPAAGGENPYAIHADLQETMNDLVGIIRTEDEVEQALARLEALKVRAGKISVQGDKVFNPGWHLALDLPNMLIVSECVARAALIREESRGGHTRDDFPAMSPEWRKVNLVCRPVGDGVEVTQQPLPVMPPELLSLFERDELNKYMTEDELATLPEEKA